MNFARTTSSSLTGMVIRVSNVPENFSWAKSRMVIIGAASNRMSQKNCVT